MNNQNESYCSPKLTTVCDPNLSHPLWGFGQGFLTLHGSTSLPGSPSKPPWISPFAMNLCTHFTHHHNIYIPFVSFVHPKDTVDSMRKMLFYLSVCFSSKLQDRAYSSCLVNHCGLNKIFWAPEWPPFRKPLNHPFLEEKKKAANKQNFLTKPVESQIKDTQIVVKAFWPYSKHDLTKVEGLTISLNSKINLSVL